MNTAPPPRTVDVGDLTVGYRTWGEGSAPPLVLLHGLTSSSAAWDAVARPLGRRWRVYAPDARGHGDTDRTESYRFAAMAADLGGFLDALDLRRPVVVGHSMGGIAAYRYACSAPDRLAGLVLSETPPPHPIRRPLPPRPDRPLSYDYAAREAVVRQLAEPDPDWWESFDAIPVPSLVIGGGPDSPFDQHLMAEMAARLRRSRFVTIAAGHRIPAVAPTALAEAVAEFVSTSIDLGASKS